MLGHSLFAASSSGLLMRPRARSSAVLMYCRPVATLYSVNIRVPVALPVAPAPEARTDATSARTATGKAALRPRLTTPAAVPRRGITYEGSGRGRKPLSVLRLFRGTEPLVEVARGSIARGRRQDA